MFHRTLKYIYMKGRINIRMDKCIQVLLNLARDKAFERLVKLENGKASSKMKTITNRHQQSLSLDPRNITQKNETLWIVASSDGSTEYTVTKMSTKCPHACLLQCSECNICIHMYTCTCLDHLTQNTICKHIHLIAHESHNRRLSKGIQTPYLVKIPFYSTRYKET